MVALAGAEFSAEMDGAAVPFWTSFLVKAGGVLTIGTVGGPACCALIVVIINHNSQQRIARGHKSMRRKQAAAETQSMLSAAAVLGVRFNHQDRLCRRLLHASACQFSA